MAKDTIKNILIVSKQGCKQASDISKLLREHIAKAATKTTKVSYNPAAGGQDSKNVDLVVAVGGDGTLLRAAAAFSSTGTHSPLFLPVAGGASLGFMLPFVPDHAIKVLSDLLVTSLPKNISVLERMRLLIQLRDLKSRKILRQSLALNEVNIHRGSSPSLARIHCAVDGTPLTCAISDGLLASTPTGSTAYSLSAGGPIIHPALSGILLTPICPRSLSFRPALLPPTAQLTVGLDPASRAKSLKVSLDGAKPFSLTAEHELCVSQAKFPLRVLCHKDPTKDWVQSINSLLYYNLCFPPSAKPGE